MSTDIEWEKWGARDPYFGVLTDPRFRAGAMTPQAREEFFALGRLHVDHVLHVIRCHLDGAFAPTRTLDFGCGVGRLLMPFARLGGEVVGVDISPSMLAEARRNCDREGLSNVVLLPSDDALSAVDGDFDLVHSCIVLQHVEIPRGLVIFDQLVRRVRPGGMGAIHITFGWDAHAATLGVPPPPSAKAPSGWVRARRWLREWVRGKVPAPVASAAPAAGADPEMQMNFYNASQLLFILQRAGVGAVYSELTDHGGALGLFMFFRR
jgi:SAM-dependent methyltransferase